ncbi:hypothetical protein HCH_04106 [Hahella chejuensis KCTC 2396]|uniref:Uncharacterized protein n=1 Tax=Hahella chejuensis (strain KCTC 2396) TaxID=349521 RepID=Q2SEV7_HAHCH|nr:hypothetical protein HCH_04106 [Hahella chejuensis KCTC 2396]
MLMESVVSMLMFLVAPMSQTGNLAFKTTYVY